MKRSNKVKFGLKNCHYAKATFDEDGNVTYDKPVRMPGAVSLSLDPEGENANFYADDVVFYVINNNSGYSGNLELALIPESFTKDILHEEEDANGVMAENNTVSYERFALLFEFSGDAKAIRHVLQRLPSCDGRPDRRGREGSPDRDAVPVRNGAAQRLCEGQDQREHQRCGLQRLVRCRVRAPADRCGAGARPGR